MKYGLTESELKDIQAVLSHFPNVQKTVLFGSRAAGTHRPGSDIDLAIYGEQLTFDEYLEMKIALEEIGMLQEMDVVRFKTIDHPEFVDHIERVGIELYKKERQE